MSDHEHTSTHIDEVDRSILKILQSDGRTALSEIARRLDMGSATIHERVRSLEEQGYIREYRAILDPKLLGIDQVAFVQVETTAGRFSEVAERLAEHREVQEVHEITGDFDLLLKVRVEETDDLSEFLSKLGESDGVRKSSTNVSLRTVKEDGRLDLNGQ
ncbi:MULTISPECIES: Lrp/AsnC family transcriptional regulator [Haloferax]|uniref:Winged helix-turn-helix transcriptional regulator n=1 Tax=Haloferax marinum TaxID=2666143 RepID=A0A6A8GDN0_9EURY|nr:MULTISPECIES: Lrp/AsnC family transcriptional regulator [Haloferax]KAB1190702.1 Lrp/AsnC family transcriptional regulator [Haloferax sp. CBA1150]MRW98233.1 winged helix-turn-helix transcriptional regulator [Haloferax marinum]